MLVVDDDDDDSGEDGDSGHIPGENLPQVPPAGGNLNENLELAPVDEIPELVDVPELQANAAVHDQPAAPPAGENNEIIELPNYEGGNVNLINLPQQVEPAGEEIQLADAHHQEVDISDHEFPVRLVPETVWESRRRSSLHSIQEEMDFLSRDRGDSYQFRLMPPVDQFGITDSVAMEFFVRHLMVRVKRDLERIKVWNVPVVLCEPVMCSHETRRELLRILFEKLLIQR